MHGLGIIQKVQQYLKLVRIFWRNCLEFFSFQMNGERDSRRRDPRPPRDPRNSRDPKDARDSRDRDPRGGSGPR